MTSIERINKGQYWDRALSIVEGCSQNTSPGCLNCWSAAATHMRQDNIAVQSRYIGLTNLSGHFNGQIRLMEKDLEKPLHVRKPTTWACWNDLFHEKVPFEFIDRALAVMALCPQHTFIVLTKRAQRMAEYFSRVDECGLNANWYLTLACNYVTDKYIRRLDGDLYLADEIQFPLPNLILGVTAENQEQADRRIPILISIPAAVRFVSVEPMLGPMDLSFWLDRASRNEVMADGSRRDRIGNLHWVICGCESGPNRRRCELDWIRSVVQQCQAAGVKIFVKQLEINGRVSHDMADFPEDLRIRQIPERPAP